MDDYCFGIANRNGLLPEDGNIGTGLRLVADLAGGRDGTGAVIAKAILRA